MLKPRERLVALSIAVAGLAACTGAFGVFVLKILFNRLPWRVDQTAREHYLAVGNAYSNGFATGFFFCFFLTLLAVAVAAWVQQKRALAAAARVRSSPPEAAEVPALP